MSVAPIPSSPADLELIAQLKSKLQYAELRIRVLEERLRLMRIEKYGAGGEKLSQAQIRLFDIQPVVSEVVVQAESEPLHRPTKQSTNHPGRRELPANLPRVERILPCTPDQHLCTRCGRETVVIGYEESSQLDVEPAKYFVLVTKREKRACRSCEDLGVVSAPLAPRIIEKCLASGRIVIDTVVSKYCNHMPLHRQSVILERDIGLELSRATLDGWVLKVGELLIPLVAAMRRELIDGTYIQADETPVGVQTREGRGQNHQAYLWQYSRPGGSVVFDFRLGRGRDGPRQFLGQFEGILQTDGYAAYDQIGGTRMVHAACWAHARRQFFEAVRLNPRDPVATPIVAQMDELFAVEAEARRRVIGLTARHALRQERAKPLLDDIRSKIEEAQWIALPSSALSKACQYVLTLWRKLTRFLEYPELELSNNLAENSMRPVALGRKNWLHIGSPQAGPKVAAILSVVESCRRLHAPGARLLFHDSPRACRSPDPVPSRPYSRCVGRPAFIDSGDWIRFLKASSGSEARCVAGSSSHYFLVADPARTWFASRSLRSGERHLRSREHYQPSFCRTLLRISSESSGSCTARASTTPSIIAGPQR